MTCPLRRRWPRGHLPVRGGRAEAGAPRSRNPLAAVVDASHWRTLDLCRAHEAGLPVPPLSRCPFTGRVVQHWLDHATSTARGGTASARCGRSRLPSLVACSGRSLSESGGCAAAAAPSHALRRPGRGLGSALVTDPRAGVAPGREPGAPPPRPPRPRTVAASDAPAARSVAAAARPGMSSPRTRRQGLWLSRPRLSAMAALRASHARGRACHLGTAARPQPGAASTQERGLSTQSRNVRFPAR